MARFGRQVVLLLAVAFNSCCAEAPAELELPLPHMPPAPKPQSSSAPLKVPVPGQPLKNAIDVLDADLWTLLTGREYQSFVAIFAFVFGLIALIDGRRLFRAVVVASFAVGAFVVALSQLQSTWEGHEAIAKYVVALEVGVFAGFAAHKTWEGTQLILGAVFGLYLFLGEQDLAVLVPSIASASQQSLWMVVVGSICIAAGIAMVHDKYGGPKVLGFIASMFGGSLVVSAIGYFSMFVCTLPSPPIHVDITRAQVASVYEFWYMMAFPLRSNAVGLFAASHNNAQVGSHTIEWDRVLSIFFWLLFFVAGSRLQIKAANRVSDTLTARLLTKEQGIGFEGHVIKIEA